MVKKNIHFLKWEKSDPSDSNMQTQYVLIKEQKSDPTSYGLANIWDRSILIAF